MKNFARLANAVKRQAAVYEATVVGYGVASVVTSAAGKSYFPARLYRLGELEPLLDTAPARLGEERKVFAPVVEINGERHICSRPCKIEILPTVGSTVAITIKRGRVRLVR